jgi:phosphatidate phosphatase APP1
MNISAIKPPYAEAGQGGLSIETGKFKGHRFISNVVRAVSKKAGVTSARKLINEAIKIDDGNGYLNRTELQTAAAKINKAARRQRTSHEIGIISDIDKTVVPKHKGWTLPKKAYPGVAALFRELEFQDKGKAGDTYFVTARQPGRIKHIPAWLEKQGVPTGPIETGISGNPHIALPNKVQDISGIMKSNPGQAFVLFSDSNHRDPEVFARILKKFPDQVALAIVHKVNKEVKAKRVEGMTLIENYVEAAVELFKAGIITKRAASRVIKAARSEGLRISDAEIRALFR